MPFRKPKKLGIWIALGAAVVIALLYFIPFAGSNLITGDAGWTTSGCFQPNGVLPSTGGAPRGLNIWGSWRSDGGNTGELRSPPFPAPFLLEVFLAGNPAKPGLGVFVQAEGTTERIPLTIRTDFVPGNQWSRFHWKLPAQLRGKPVRLIAVDQAAGPDGWIGISAPRRLLLFALAHEQLPAALLTLLVYLFDYGLFLLPGFALATIDRVRKRIQSPMHLLILIIATGATLGYISFWAFFWGKPAGRLFSDAVYGASVCLLLLALRRKNAVPSILRAVREPLIYAAAAGAAYLGLFYLFTQPASVGGGLAVVRFFQEIRPGDNQIPAIFADKLFFQQPLRPFCCGDWLSSDRPPLQSGVVLLERPLRVARNLDFDYELLSAALQSLWICGVWSLLTALGATNLHIRQTLGFLIFSGFFFYNTVYTWPKFLAAACILFVLSILFEAIRTKQPFGFMDFALAGLCLGLALMAHPGSMFSLTVFGVLLIRFRHLFSFRGAALAAGILVLFVAPWSAYQKFVDPPGNRLLKMHLAGEGTIDPQSAWQGIKDAYRIHTLRQIVEYKSSNLLLLAGSNPLDTFGVGAILHGGIDYSATERSRISQREWIWNAAGILNAGRAAWLWIAIRRKRIAPPIPFAGWLIGASIVNLVFWSVITFGPNETVTTHSSYADILLLCIGLIGFILTLPRMIRCALLALQIFNLCVVWVWSYPPAVGTHEGILAVMVQWPMLIAGAALLVALLYVMSPHRPRANLVSL